MESNKTTISQSDDQFVIITKSKQEIEEVIMNYEPISVPFSVVSLMVHPDILVQLKRLGIGFHNHHDAVTNGTYHNWKLHSKGFYFNRTDRYNTIIVMEGKYYEGSTD